MSIPEDKDSLKSKTVTGILWGGMSNVLQQVFGVVFGVVLARILSPDDYGMIGMVTIFSVLASALQESGFVSGVANLKDVSDRDYNAVFWCSILVSFCLYILLFFLSPAIADFYGIPELVWLARISFLSFLVGSFGIAHSAYLFRNLMVRERSITMLTATVLSGGAGVAMAMKGLAYWGLAAQVVIYSLVTSVLATVFSNFRPSIPIDLRPIRRLLGYSSKVLITNVFINLNNHVYALILGRFYNPSEVGDLTQANKWTLMSQSVISGMATNITQPVMREVSQDEERKKRVFRKIVEFTAFIACPLMFGLALLSRDFILITITEKWMRSASFLSVLCLGGAFAVISTVFANFILSRGKSSVYMWSIISFGCLQIFLFLILYPYGVMYMVVSSAILHFLWLFVWFLQVRRLMDYTVRNLCSDVFAYVVLAGLSIGVGYLLGLVLEHLYMRFILSIFVVCTVYAVLNWIFKPVMIREVFSFFVDKIIRR